MLRSIATVSDFRHPCLRSCTLLRYRGGGYQVNFRTICSIMQGTPAEIRQLAADLGLKMRHQSRFQPSRFEGASRAQLRRTWLALDASLL